MKLLPCPFCGSEKLAPATLDRAFVECLNCEAYGPTGMGRRHDEMRMTSSMVRWNERAEIEEYYRGFPRQRPKGV